jgi:subtilisin-like proprotein convertase family protein
MNLFNRQPRRTHTESVADSSFVAPTSARAKRALMMGYGLELLERREFLSLAGVLSSSAAAGEAVGTFYLPQQHHLIGEPESSSVASSADPLSIAVNYLKAHASELGLNTKALRSYKVTDQYTDNNSGLTHIYLRQMYRGIEIINADASVHIAADGRVISASSSFIPIKKSPTAPPLRPSVNAARAWVAFSGTMSLSLSSTPSLIESNSTSADKATTVTASGAALADVPAKLVHVPTPKGLRLAWELSVQTADGDHWYQAYINAKNAKTLYANDWVDFASYNVYSLAANSPLEGSRTIVTNPHDPVASPYGWHDTDGVAGAEYTDTRGNNAFVQEDQDNNDTGGTRPSGGAGLNFDFPVDLTQNPSTYVNAAITNAFYWTNALHDIHYRYGFTEAAGNFQLNNYGKGGAGNDPVITDVHDGRRVNNAHFFSTPDGFSPRMELYLFNYTNPQRDTALDGPVIIHEYGHGVSGRLTGGPANANALDGIQSSSMGEGWSDWWALMFSQTATDTKLAPYPFENYIVGQPASGPGFRAYPYSFNMSIDPLVYSNYNGGFPNNEVHKAGSIWCSALWDMNWLLVDKYGFSSDMYTGNGGNNLAMQLVMDALKLQPANPTFISGRDAILAADQALTGGQNRTEIWTAFARRGMGYSANDGGNSNAVTVTAAYDMPPGGTISGTVFRDDDGNGTRDAAEPGLAGWTVYRDRNNNGVLDVTTTSTFTSVDIPKAMADPGTTYSNLNIAGLWGNVTDVNVTVNLSHPIDGQIYVSLFSPGNTPVILSNYQGGTGSNFTNTTFDDSAETPIASGTAPFTGTFKPHFELARVNRSNPNGTWKLRLDDAVAGDAGTILGWSLQLTYGGGETTTLTDADGNYSFSEIPNGTHVIREVNQAGYVQTAPLSGAQNVVVTGGQASVGNNFANQPGIASTIPGTPDLDSSSDTGSSSSDDLTRLDNSSLSKVLTFNVPGTVSGALVTLYADSTPIGSAIANGSTTLITSNGALDLTDGSHAITARQLEPGMSLSPPSAALALLIDTLSPSVTIDQYPGTPDPTSGTFIYFTATFSEPVSDFVSGDVTLGGSAGANTVQVGSGSTQFNMAVSGMTTSGTVTASIAAGAATDAAGNSSSASTSTDNTVTYGTPLSEISVTGNGVDIADADATPSAIDGSDFGAAVQGAAGPVRTFTVTNSGAGTLTLGAVNVPAGFALGSDPLVSSLAPGASDTFTVILSTAAVGNFAGEIVLTNNDTDENPYNFRIAGSVNPLVNTKPVIAYIIDSPDPVIKGSLLTLTANGVSDPDAGDAVDKIEFYRDANGNSALDPAIDLLLGSDSDASDGWSVSVDTTVLPAGTNRYFARAFDGVFWSSSATTTGVVNVLPTIAYLLAAPTVSFKGDNITLTAGGVADTAPGTVASVEFYRDVNTNGVIDVGIDSLLGSDTSSSGGWTKTVATTSFPIGNVTLLARVKDNNAGYSATVTTTIFVDAKPTVGSLAASPNPLIPGNALTLTAGSIADSDGTVTTAEFYRDSNGNKAFDVGIDTLLASDNNGSDGWSVVVPGSTTASFSVGATTYFVRVQDNLGAWSASRSVAGAVSNPPVVGTLAALPANINKGSTLTLTATDVTDPDAGQTIASVTFYRDSNNSGSWESSDSVLGTDTNSSDGWSWTGSTSAFLSGNVRLFARAKDNLALSSVTAASTLVYVNALPVITVPTTTLNYSLGSAALVISSTASVTDSNSPDFSSGSLTVQFANGSGQADDRLVIRNQGGGAGQIGVYGNGVYFAGTLIGTWTGGTDGSTALVISLNASATIAATQALARNITYQSVAAPGTVTASGARGISFVVDDGDGAQSIAAVRTIQVL